MFGSPFFLKFVTQSGVVTEIFPVNVLGFQTHRDKFAVDFDYQEVYERIQEMRNLYLTDEEFRQKYGLSDNRDWQLSKARVVLRSIGKWEDYLAKCSYRPFDW